MVIPADLKPAQEPVGDAPLPEFSNVVCVGEAVGASAVECGEVNRLDKYLGAQHLVLCDNKGLRDSTASRKPPDEVSLLLDDLAMYPADPPHPIPAVAESPRHGGVLSGPGPTAVHCANGTGARKPITWAEALRVAGSISEF